MWLRYPFCFCCLVCCWTELATRIRTLERANRMLKSEKNQLEENVAKVKENAASKDKDLREVRSLYRESQDEITLISDK